MATPFEPQGPTITIPPAQPPSPSTRLEGKHVTLIPLNPSHAPTLYTTIGGPENNHLWTYLPTGPYPDFDSFGVLIDTLTNSSLFFPFVILSHISKSNSEKQEKGEEEEVEGEEGGKAVGIACYLNIEPENRRIEIGAIVFGEELKGSTGATEALGMLMGEAFRLGFLRVEWKCNTLNTPSSRAALRLGFIHEGIFRKHMVVKGKGRDTWWGSVTDEEWAGPREGEKLGVRDALAAWLDEGNFDGEERQRRRLGDIRVLG